MPLTAALARTIRAYMRAEWPSLESISRQLEGARKELEGRKVDIKRLKEKAWRD